MMNLGATPNTTGGGRISDHVRGFVAHEGRSSLACEESECALVWAGRPRAYPLGSRSSLFSAPQQSVQRLQHLLRRHTMSLTKGAWGEEST
jgi:hypothetical protein